MIDARPRIAVSLGDQAGIGPEIVAKAILDERVKNICVPVLFGDRGALELHARACGLSPRLAVVKSAEEAAKIAIGDRDAILVDLDQFQAEPLRIGEIAANHGRAAVEAAAAAVKAALDGHVAAVVCCPQTEISIKKAGFTFDGYPSFVARQTGTPEDDAFLMICFDDKRIVHMTLHVSLAQAIRMVTPERVRRVIMEAHTTLKRLGIENPRICVSGLNPHAGEHGMFGSEENDIIEPAIKACAAQGVQVDGPFGADTMFHKKGYDAFIVMIHDQGHVAAKLLANNRTAGMTIGTPIIFSSMAHGSALDIAGKNQASPAAVIEALQRVTHAKGRAQSKAA